MIELTEELLQKLSDIAKRNNKSEQEVLEYLIENRWLISDVHRNAMRKLEAWEKYQKHTNFDPTDEARVFFAGYNAGWWDFQTRHENEKQVLPPDTPNL